MGNFNKDDRRGNRGGGSFGGGRNFGGRDGGFGGRGDGQAKFQAVCSKCNKSCEVPFKPTGERPVFCADCFRAQRQGRQERPAGQSFGRANFDEQQKQRIAGGQNIEQFRSQFEVLNVKLDKILKMLAPAAPLSAVLEMTAPSKDKKSAVVKKLVAKKVAKLKR